jgi:hypothetical protein
LKRSRLAAPAKRKKIAVELDPNIGRHSGKIRKPPADRKQPRPRRRSTVTPSQRLAQSSPSPGTCRPAPTELPVGGAQLPYIVKAPTRKTASASSTLGTPRSAIGWVDGIGFARAIDGQQHHGYEIGRILLYRAGGDLDAKIIDHIDQIDA